MLWYHAGGTTMVLSSAMKVGWGTLSWPWSEEPGCPSPTPPWLPGSGHTVQSCDVYGIFYCSGLNLSRFQLSSLTKPRESLQDLFPLCLLQKAVNCLHLVRSVEFSTPSVVSTGQPRNPCQRTDDLL